MSKKAIFFDLDGTLTDSGNGIINCATLALEHFGIPVPDRKAMGVFVGPPLRETFLSHGIREENVEEAITIFRARYKTVGKFENFPYPGIPEMLQELKRAGYPLYVATSKPEALAVEILEHFNLTACFEMICGASFDRSRDSKEAVIAYLLEQTGGVDSAIMVGDTAFDVIGASAHKIPTVGVSWGYGNVEDMVKAGAAAIVHTPQELLTYILQS